MLNKLFLIKYSIYTYYSNETRIFFLISSVFKILKFPHNIFGFISIFKDFFKYQNYTHIIIYMNFKPFVFRYINF